MSDMEKNMERSEFLGALFFVFFVGRGARGEVGFVPESGIPYLL